MDSLVYSLNRYEKVHPSLSFQASARGEAAQWQRRSYGPRLVESLGGFPGERGRLEPRVLRKEQMDGYAPRADSLLEPGRNFRFSVTFWFRTIFKGPDP